jgi:hypothetical protein
MTRARILARILGGMCVFASGCASGTRSSAPTPSSPAASGGGGVFRAAIMGDMPYHAPGDPKRDSIMAAYHAVLDTIDAENVAFVVHIGDITGATCSDSLYALRLREFSAMSHPFIYAFGDNEWTDCARDGKDPIERIAKLREVFTQGPTSLGRRTLPLERQSSQPQFAKFRENARWSVGDVTFLTLSLPGSNNNRGTDTATAPAEYVERNAANMSWLRDGFAVATREHKRGVAVFMQANPDLNTVAGRWGSRRRPDGFADFLREFQQLAVAFGKPVALVHGDTHYFRVDQPFSDSATGLTYTNITRAETYGAPNFHALMMTVDPASPNLFRFEPLAVRRNGPPR